MKASAWYQARHIEIAEKIARRGGSKRREKAILKALAKEYWRGHSSGWDDCEEEHAS